MKKILYILIVIISCLQVSFGQETPTDVSNMTKEDVLSLTYDQLLEMPFEDLLKLAEIVGVSLDELYEMILNKDLVSASKKVESSFVSPLSTSVISYDDIKASGARTIEEALRLIPGLIVHEKTNGNYDMHIRGNNNLPPNHMFIYSENSITLVMIDNRPVYNYVHGGTFWETLPIDMEDIDRIEVVRGPSSALYGPNSVSGVVNIITKRPEDKELHVGGNIQAGTQTTGIANLGLGKGINDKLSFRVTGNFQYMKRNSDLLYVYKANFDQLERKYYGELLTKEQLDTLHDPDPANAQYYVFDPTDNLDDMLPDPKLSRNRQGVNAYLFYDIADDVKMDFKGGYQYSQIISTSMGDNPMAHVGRQSSTYYLDYNANIKGLRAQVNLTDGWQDILRQDTGFKVEVYNLNANLEYDWNIGNLNLRPGVSYQEAKYNDEPFLRYQYQGFLNGEKNFTTMAASIRADYLAFEKLRLIGALRTEKYSTHDDPYLSYQGIVSYNLADMHNLRLVASRANRSPFLVDTYADYHWTRSGRPDPGYILFQGSKNQDLLTMDMFEFGYRIKPTKQIQADLEVFYTKAYNYGALYPDSINLAGDWDADMRSFVRMSFDNIDLESEQMGFTATVTYVANENLIFKAFGTYQQTQLTNVIPITQDETIARLILSAITSGSMSSTSFYPERENTENLATPSFFGGIVIDYSPLEKLKINMNSYFYTGREFQSKYGVEILDPKVILNMNVTYLINENMNVNLNGRNLLMKKKEFGYMDEIGTNVLIGLNINF